MMKKIFAILSILTVSVYGQDKKISQLTPLPSVNGSELIPVARSGANYYMTPSQLPAYLSNIFIPLAGTGTVSPLYGTISYSASANSTAFVSTNTNYYTGAGNDIDLSSATIFARTLNAKTGYFDSETQDASGNFAEFLLSTKVQGTYLTCGDGTYSTGRYLFNDGRALIQSSFSGFKGNQYNSTTCDLVNANADTATMPHVGYIQRMIDASAGTTYTVTAPLSISTNTISLLYGTGLSLSTNTLIVSGLTNSHLSGSAGITNANLANSTFTVNGIGGTLGASSTGTLSTTYGGTGINNATNTSGSILRSNGTNGNFAASTATYPNTITANQVLYATGTNAIGSSSALTFTGSILKLGTGSSLGNDFNVTGSAAAGFVGQSLTNDATSGGATFNFGTDISNRLNIQFQGSTYSGNIGSGVSIPFASTALIRTTVGGTFGTGNLSFNSGRIYVIGGLLSIGTNYGSVHDLVGFRIDQMSTLTTTNLNPFTVNGKSYLGGNATATAYLHLAAGTASASTAPFKFTQGTQLTTAENLVLEPSTDGTALLYTNNNGVRQNISLEQQSRVTTQFDAVGSTTLTAVTGLTATVVSGKTYSFEAVLHVTLDGSGGSKFSIDGTATATNIIYQITMVDNSTNLNSITVSGTALGTSGGNVGTTSGYCIIKGLITVNAGGTLTPKFSQTVSSGTSSVLVGSTFITKQLQ